MLSDDVIRAGYKKSRGKEMSEANLQAFKRLVVVFKVDHLPTYEEQKNAMANADLLTLLEVSRRLAAN